VAFELSLENVFIHSFLIFVSFRFNFSLAIPVSRWSCEASCPRSCAFGGEKSK